MDLLGESDSGVIVRNLTESGRVTASQRNAVVDIENSGGATRRPDDSGSGNLVLLGINLA